MDQSELQLFVKHVENFKIVEADSTSPDPDAADGSHVSALKAILELSTYVAKFLNFYIFLVLNLQLQFCSRRVDRRAPRSPKRCSHILRSS